MNISQVTKKYGIPADTLRYYEKIGLLPEVNRKESGIRDYDTVDLGWIEYIKCMRDAGIPIRDLAHYVELFKQGNETKDERKQILIDSRDDLIVKIQSMQKALDMLTHKIEVYDTLMAEYEKKLKAKK